MISCLFACNSIIKIKSWLNYGRLKLSGIDKSNLLRILECEGFRNTSSSRRSRGDRTFKISYSRIGWWISPLRSPDAISSLALVLSENYFGNSIILPNYSPRAASRAEVHHSAAIDSPRWGARRATGWEDFCALSHCPFLSLSFNT